MQHFRACVSFPFCVRKQREGLEATYCLIPAELGSRGGWCNAKFGFVRRARGRKSQNCTSMGWMSLCQNPSQQTTHPTDHDTLSCGPCLCRFKGVVCLCRLKGVVSHHAKSPRNQVLLAHSLLGSACYFSSAYYFSSACHAQCHKGKATISQTKFLDCKVHFPSWPYIRRSARFHSSAVFWKNVLFAPRSLVFAIMESTHANRCSFGSSC